MPDPTVKKRPILQTETKAKSKPERQDILTKCLSPMAAKSCCYVQQAHHSIASVKS